MSEKDWLCKKGGRSLWDSLSATGQACGGVHSNPLYYAKKALEKKQKQIGLEALNFELWGEQVKQYEFEFGTFLVSKKLQWG